MPRPALTEEEKLLREQQKLARTAADTAIKTLATSYGLRPEEKRALLKHTDRLHLTEQAADVILTRLVPKALAVWETALDSGNVDVATRVIEGAALLGFISEWKKPAPAEAQTLDFELVRETIIGRARVATGGTTAATPGGDGSPVHDQSTTREDLGACGVAIDAEVIGADPRGGVYALPGGHNHSAPGGPAGSGDGEGEA